MMGFAASQLPEMYNGVLKPPYTLISPAPMELLVPSIGLYVALAVGIAGAPAGVLAFGEEKAMFFREAAAGHSPLAYYIAKSLSVFYRFTLGALHFTAVFHVLGGLLRRSTSPCFVDDNACCVFVLNSKLLLTKLYHDLIPHLFSQTIHAFRGNVRHCVGRILKRLWTRCAKANVSC